MAFCICLKRSLHNVNVGVVLAYLEYLVENNVSVHKVSNNISAIRASLIMYGLDYLYLDHPRCKVFCESIKNQLPSSSGKEECHVLGHSQAFDTVM